MKRYIKASFTPDIDIDYSMFDGTPFKCDTGTSYGNNFLNKKDLAHYQKTRNRTGRVAMLSPEDYFWMCSMYGFSRHTSVEKLKEERRYDEKNINKYKQMMQDGIKFDMCYINKADHMQEGLHRMMAAGDLYGWDTEFPVLIIDVYDQEEENRRKLRDEAYDFRNNTFKDICKWAATDLLNYATRPPENFEELYRDAIFHQVNSYYTFDWEHKDIDFDIDMDEYEGLHRFRVWLTKYNDLKFEYLAEPYEGYLEDLFDLDSDMPYKKFDMHDIDFDDIDSDLLL